MPTTSKHLRQDESLPKSGDIIIKQHGKKHRIFPTKVFIALYAFISNIDFSVFLTRRDLRWKHWIWKAKTDTHAAKKSQPGDQSTTLLRYRRCHQVWCALYIRSTTWSIENHSVATSRKSFPILHRHKSTTIVMHTSIHLSFVIAVLQQLHFFFPYHIS